MWQRFAATPLSSLLCSLSNVSGCSAAGNFHVKQLDVTDDASIQKCIADTIKEHGRLDVLVNNAGYGTEKNVEQVVALHSSDIAHDSMYSLSIPSN